MRPLDNGDSDYNRRVNLDLEYDFSSGVYDSWSGFKEDNGVGDLKDGDVLYRDGLFGVWSGGELKEFVDDIGMAGSKGMSFLDLLLSRYEVLDGDDLSKCECYVGESNVKGNFDAEYGDFLVKVPFVVSKKGVFKQVVYKIHFNGDRSLDSGLKGLGFTDDDINVGGSRFEDYDNCITVRRVVNLDKYDVFDVDPNNIEWDDIVRMSQVDDGLREVVGRVEDLRDDESIDEVRVSEVKEGIVEEVNDDLPEYLEVPVMGDKEEFAEEYEDIVGLL